MHWSKSSPKSTEVNIELNTAIGHFTLFVVRSDKLDRLLLSMHDCKTKGRLSSASYGVAIQLGLGQNITFDLRALF